MSKRKCILLCAVLALFAATAAVLYIFSDRDPPEITAVDAYWTECGKEVKMEELVARVEDKSNYTVKLYGDGVLGEDQQSITFHQVGTFQVTIEATDDKGHNAKKTVLVTTVDRTPPELTVKTIKTTLGKTINYQKAVKAVDRVDGDLSELVEVEDIYVNPRKTGSYTAVYSIEDRSGNRAESRGLVVIQPVMAKKIKLNQTELFLSGNQHAELTAKVSPDNWAGNIKWTSSDPSIATVSDGLISWVAPGSCTITAQADKKKTKCAVTCGYVLASSVRLSRYSVTLQKGDMTILTAEASPTNWTGEITWESSDPNIAKVRNGVVTAVKPGKCQIIAKSGDAKASCNVTCRRKRVDTELGELWDDITNGPVERDTDDKSERKEQQKPSQSTKATKSTKETKSGKSRKTRKTT